MKIVVIHGQTHKGSTYHITKLLLDNLVNRFKDDEDMEIVELYVNQIKPCVGCFTCILKDETLCPHREQIETDIEVIEAADIVIGESPNYCMGMTGQLKTFFDHMAYRWMSHRPHPSMVKKIGVAISTTAGVGAGAVTKSIKQQLFWWGIPRIYRISECVAAMSWNDVKPEKKQKIEARVNKIARQIQKKFGKVKPGMKYRFLFRLMKMQQKNNTWNQVDKKHWEENGWI